MSIHWYFLTCVSGGIGLLALLRSVERLATGAGDSAGSNRICFIFTRLRVAVPAKGASQNAHPELIP